jgi:hypothetical protein
VESLYYYYLYSRSKSYGPVPTFLDLSELPTEGFISLYFVTQTTAAALHEEGTTAGFKGAVWGPRLWVDVDDYTKAGAVESRLRNMGLHFDSYDSGGKGAHFGILRNHAPSHLLPAKDKQWVQRNIPEADLSIYTHLHPFRLEGTHHEDTGRVKVLVASCPGQALTLPPLDTKIQKVPQGEKSIFDCFRVMSNISPVSEGERHDQLVRLTYALRDDAKVGLYSALWVVDQVNKRFEKPKEYHEIEKIISSIYAG